MQCEIHGLQMEYMGEEMGIDLWSCPACVAEEEALFQGTDDDYVYLPGLYDEDDLDQEPIS